MPNFDHITKHNPCEYNTAFMAGFRDSEDGSFDHYLAHEQFLYLRGGKYFATTQGGK